MNLKKFERYLRVNLLGPGPHLIKKEIYRAAVSQRLRNTAIGKSGVFVFSRNDSGPLWQYFSNSVLGHDCETFETF